MNDRTNGFTPAMAEQCLLFSNAFPDQDPLCGLHGYRFLQTEMVQKALVDEDYDLAHSIVDAIETVDNDGTFDECAFYINCHDVEVLRSPADLIAALGKDGDLAREILEKQGLHLTPQDEEELDDIRRAAKEGGMSRKDARFYAEFLLGNALISEQGLYNVRSGLTLIPDINGDGKLFGVQYAFTPLITLMQNGKSCLPCNAMVYAIENYPAPGAIGGMGFIPECAEDTVSIDFSTGTRTIPQESSSLAEIVSLIEDDVAKSGFSGAGWCLSDPESIAGAALAVGNSSKGYDISMETRDMASGSDALTADTPARNALLKDDQNIG